MKDTFTVLVEKGATLPNIGKELYTKSPLTKIEYVIKITKIKHLQWNENNELIVEVEGNRSEVIS
ncbi:hypothetical protein [Bacillus mycoides]|uniref:Uncharacterized protein n=1 Tax=Bacillus mycoides TaxID=1405 RepID=A0A4U3A663_BACMY|nr:hypothetical protein [Bacillus mycoides]TKI83434.1 hypothetical protein FC701_17735 [Bacillus mycoides]